MPSRRQLLLAGLLVIASAVPAMAARGPANEVRVRLFERVAPQALAVSTNRGFLFLDGEGAGVLAELPPYEKATIRREGAGMRVTTRGTTFHARALRLVPRDDALFDIEVLEGKRTQKPRRYPGRLKLAAGGDTPALTVVNHVLLDEYVACVVSSEYGFDDLEGAKAMAVLARTYVLRNASASGGAYDLVDHQLAQQYDGADRLTDAAIEATIATLGEVLTYQGDLVEAVYFSSSGGHTADNDAVWNGKPLPYLRGVPDPYDEASPHSRWRTTIPRGRLLRALSQRYGLAVDDFQVARRSRDGRARTIALMQQNQMAREIQSNEFRLLVNQNFGITSLKSTLFDVQASAEQYIFEGRGFGHGVGMSQYGALGMSKQGYSYRDILSFYFTGTQVQRWR